MLTHPQYIALWAHMPVGLVPAAPPSYHQYLQREIYFNDYLDLFRHHITFNRVLIGGVFCVQIAGVLANLEIPFDEEFVVHENGEDYLIVEYDYPWDAEQLNAPKCIKYIMVGEAPPPHAGQTYFYNLLHLNNTAWLNAPCAAFGVAAALKVDKLYQLACNGYVLLDLFKFATPFNQILREALINNGFAEDRFNHGVLFEINALELEGLICNEGFYFEKHNNPPFDKRAIIAFSGPPLIHHHLAGLIHAGVIVLPPYLQCFAYQNIPGPAIIPPPISVPFPIGMLLHGLYLNPGYASAPYFRCCCYSGANYPNQFFIRVAFGLLP